MHASTPRRIATSALLAVSLALGPVAVAPAQAAGTGSISGSLVDTVSREPLGAASVKVRPADDDNAEPISADTAEDGTFTVPDLPVGAYTVEFRDVSGEHLTEYYADATRIADATEVPVTDGAPTSVGVVGLDKGASLSGAVETTRVPAPGEPAEVPVPGATVTVLPMDGQVIEQHLTTVKTDAKGDYSLTHLPAGGYKLKISAPGYFDGFSGSQRSEELAEEESVGVGQDVPVDTIVIDEKAGIVGSVENASGDGLSGIDVEAVPVSDGAAAAGGAVSGINGTFELADLRAGTYQLRFRDPSGVYQEQAGPTMEIEGGETRADASVTVLSPVVPPAPSTPPVVAKRSASVKVRAKGARKKATLTITVRASGVTPTGKVTIRLGSRTLKTVTLRNGRAKVTLKKQKKGKRTYKVVYSGDSRVRAKTVTTKKVRIR
jgi:hypothetical protein